PRGARHVVTKIGLKRVQFQSTRPRGARLDDHHPGVGLLLVSIHAPAWGATSVQHIRENFAELVSIHAPAWGATYWCQSKSCAGSGFNPRARVGRDLLPALLDESTEMVSIHAPAWGATKPGSNYDPGARKFQSTRPRGARHDYHVELWSYLKFQSTRPRGARRASTTKGVGYGAVSIHAPAWGATYDEWYAGWERIVSIHAPAWGATANVTSTSS